MKDDPTLERLGNFKGKLIVMIGTSFSTKGGVSAVLNVYREAGFFERWPIAYISTHADGSRTFKTWIAIAAFARYVGLLVCGRVGILHVHSASNASFWRKTFFIVPTFFMRLPVIFHLHGGGFVEFYDHKCGGIGRRIVRWVLNRAAFVLVMSEQWKTALSRITCNRNIVPVYNPVGSLRVPPGDASVRRGDVVLFLARISKDKGIYDLLEAVARLCGRGRRLRLKVAGQGETAEVQRVADRLGISACVELLGWTTGAAKARLLSESTVFVLPSYFEGLPMGLLEAMGAGMPVVVTRIGAMSEVVQDDVEGCLVAPGDIRGLSTALDKLLVDSQLRARLGRAAQARVVKDFLPERVLPKIESIYRRIGIPEREPAN